MSASGSGGRRGGSRRESIPPDEVDVQALQQAFLAYAAQVEEPFSFGLYETKTLKNGGGAASGLGILENETFLRLVLPVLPRTRTNHGPLLAALQFALTKVKLKLGMGPQRWCDTRSQSIRALLLHLRRIKASRRKYQECCSSLTQTQTAALDAIMKLVSVGEGEGDPEPEHHPVPCQEGKRRRLGRKSSEVPVDATGWPLLLVGVSEPIATTEVAETDHSVALASDGWPAVLDEPRPPVAAAIPRGAHLRRQAELAGREPLPAGRGEVKKRVQTNRKPAAASKDIAKEDAQWEDGWRVQVIPRAAGPRKGILYKLWFAPDGHRYRTLKEAQAAGFAH